MAAGSAARPIALGVSVGEPSHPSDLDAYVAAAGRSPAIVMWFQSFDEPLYWEDQMSAVESRGAVPMITWEPTHGGVGIPLRSIASGSYDSYLKEAASAAAVWGKPMFIRFAHEMNLSVNPWGPGVDGNTPPDYIAAWRHVVTLFRDAGALNVSWVWSPNVNCGGDCPFDAFYPGDPWVDWVALDGYNYGAVHDVPWMSMAQVFGSSYDDLTVLTSKPVMIAETASTEAGGDKAAWITSGLLSDVPDRLPRVRAVVWFQRDSADTDWRVNSSPTAAAAFRAAATSPVYTSDLAASLSTDSTAAAPTPPAGSDSPAAASDNPPTAGSATSVANDASSTATGRPTQPASGQAAPATPRAATAAYPMRSSGIVPTPGLSPTTVAAPNAAPTNSRATWASNTNASTNAILKRQAKTSGHSAKSKRPPRTVTPSPMPRWFLHWASWRRHGAQSATRPKSVPHKIPRWAWPALRTLLRDR